MELLALLLDLAFLGEAVEALLRLLWWVARQVARVPIQLGMWACAAWVAWDGFAMIGRGDLAAGVALAFGAPLFALAYTASYARMRLPARGSAALPPASRP